MKLNKKLLGLILGLGMTLNGSMAFADTVQEAVNEIKHNDELIDTVVDTATQYDGDEYVWGGSSPKTSFDCSGLIQYAYKQIGIDLPRVSCQQALEGVEVSIKDIQKGDIIAFHTSDRNGKGNVSHVAVYVGNGMMFHARSNKHGIRYDEYTQAWKDKTVSVRRIIE